MKTQTSLCYYTGCADFVPSCQDPGSQLGGPANYERFENVVQKASAWAQYQQNIRITNVQSIDYKLAHESGKDIHYSKKS